MIRKVAGWAKALRRDARPAGAIWLATGHFARPRARRVEVLRV
jgi:hypothetical protein